MHSAYKNGGWYLTASRKKICVLARVGDHRTMALWEKCCSSPRFCLHRFTPISSDIHGLKKFFKSCSWVILSFFSKIHCHEIKRCLLLGRKAGTNLDEVKVTVWVVQSCLTLCDPMDCSLACQAPLSIGFSRQENWSGLPYSSPGDLPDPRIKPVSPVFPPLQTDS